MLRVIWLLLFNLTFLSGILGQIKRYYTLEDNSSFDKVNIYLKATSNSCCIKPTINPNLVNVFGYESNAMPIITSETVANERIQQLIIDLNNHSLQESNLSKKFFASAATDNHWDLYLSQEKTMQLNLAYKIGDAHVDLSNLPIEQLQIETGSADVHVEYLEGRPNLVRMDTLMVKVELGSLTVNHMDLANASKVVAEVGFGALLIDYGDALNGPSNVRASIGAGNLIVGLPQDERIPVIITIHDSPLCNVNVPKTFKKKGKNTYVSSRYGNNAENILSFDLDVAVGQIKFVYQQ